MDAPEWCHLLESGVSDSASFDNALEVHLHREYSLAAAMLRLVPPAWVADPDVSPAVKLFLQTQACEQEPWDGPAALVFSDGRYVGAKLDRNGLRPLRYTVTSDGLVILGSEAGLVDWAPVAQALLPVHIRQRLGPGEMLVVDTRAKKVLTEREIAKLLATPNNEESKPATKRLKRVRVPQNQMPEH